MKTGLELSTAEDNLLKTGLSLSTAEDNLLKTGLDYSTAKTGPRSAVGNVSGYRCVSDCRSRGREFDPGPVPYFRGD